MDSESTALGVFLAGCMALFAAIGFAAGRDAVAGDCEDLGKFRQGDKVYICLVEGGR